MSDDVARVRAWFASGALLPPDPDVPNLVDLSRAMAYACGDSALELTAAGREIAARLEGAEHLVLVVVDGLGMHQVEALRDASILRANTAMELRTVFPSSTAPALTSLATGAWPGQHAAPGWFTYLPEHDVTSLILPFVERYSKAPLASRGIDASVFPVEATAARFKRARAGVFPAAIAGSLYSRYSLPGAEQVGYRSLTGAADTIAEMVERADETTYTYFYIPFVDAEAHDHGPGDSGVQLAIARVEQALARLAAGVRGAARIVVTADHGVIEVPARSQIELRDGDPLLELLTVAPTCEPRSPAFAVREGRHAEFERAFRSRFGEWFALLTLDEAEGLGLFGGALSDVTRRRLGDYMAIAGGPHVIFYRPDSRLVGWHGGLTPDEMRIPLVVI